MDTEFFGGCLDIPDKRDYSATQILGDNSTILPEEVRLDLIEGNQAAIADTKVACTCFSSYHAAKIANQKEHGELDAYFEKGWEKQKEFGTYSVKGDSLQTALKSLKKNGLITSDNKVYPIQGYAVVNKDEVMSYLARGFAIVTMADVTKTNFVKAKTEGIWGGKDGERTTGHAFVLTGYNKDYYIASNSYGMSWGFYQDGTFRIKKEDISLLGSCYVVYDTTDGAAIFKDVTTLSPMADAIFWAKNQKVMNGYGDGSFRPDNPLTRAEFAQVLFNLNKNGYFKKAS